MILFIYPYFHDYSTDTWANNNPRWIQHLPFKNYDDLILLLWFWQRNSVDIRVNFKQLITPIFNKV